MWAVTGYMHIDCVINSDIHSIFPKHGKNLHGKEAKHLTDDTGAGSVICEAKLLHTQAETQTT